MKLRLTITSGTLAGQSFELENGFLTIGRGENCSVRFDPRVERIASKQHAFIEATPDGFFITDNQSTNGTLVNGERVPKVKLNQGDTVQFGRNGVTASIEIDDHAAPPTAANFREEELQSFQRAAEKAVTAQASLANLGLGHIELQPEPETGRGMVYVAIAAAIIGIVFLSVFVMLLITMSLSPTPDGSMTINFVGVVLALIASVVAFTPAMIYVLPLLWLDRYDPEPLWLLALAFAWGALVAVIISFIINTAAGSFTAIAIGGQEGMIVGNAVSAVISAPIVEEASKGIGLLILLFFFRRHFDDILDGIVFGGVIALGFATVENVLYYGQAILAGGLAGLALTFFMRGILSPFAHVTFTAMTGIGCGIARESHNTLVKIALPFIGYCAAVALHMLWNGVAVLGGGGAFLIWYLIIEIPFFLIFVGFSFYIMYRQNKILKEMLAIDIARGLIPQEHGEIVTSAFKSTGWLIGGIFQGKFRARNRYLRALGKLGLSYWHIQRATAAQGQTGSFQQNPILREEVLKWRDKV